MSNRPIRRFFVESVEFCNLKIAPGPQGPIEPQGPARPQGPPGPPGPEQPSTDSDRDGIPNVDDNCPRVSNLPQQDTDVQIDCIILN